MPRSRFHLLSGLGATVLITALGSVPASASASAAIRPATANLAFTSGVCPEAIYSFGCSAAWTGGSSPYTVLWTGLHNAYFSSPASYQTTAQSTSVAGICVPGGNTYYEVSIKVTDATGASIVEYMAAPCDA